MNSLTKILTNLNLTWLKNADKKIIFSAVVELITLIGETLSRILPFLVLKRSYSQTYKDIKKPQKVHVILYNNPHFLEPRTKSCSQFASFLLA